MYSYQYTGNARSAEEKRLILFLRINFLLLILAGYFNQEIGGFNLRGYLWILALLYAVAVVIRNRKFSFPIFLFIPLILYFFLELLVNYDYIGLQATGMIFSPFVFGMALSGFHYQHIKISSVLRVFWQFTNIFMVVGITYSLITEGDLSAASSAALGMTITILAAIAISSYITYDRIQFLLKYVVLILFQIFAVTRMAIAMTLILLPLSFLRVKASWRILSTLAFIGILLAVFYSKSFQRKTFFSGQGSFNEVSFSNENFQTSGRSGLYLMIQADIGKDQWFGKGPGQDYYFLKERNIPLTEFHNDYLTLIYDYGIVGMVLFLSTYLILFFMTYRLHRTITQPELRILSSTALILFLVYFGFSYTDNILKYNLFFTNIHFAIIGLLFGCTERSSRT